jgi:hypothetical protein
MENAYILFYIRKDMLDKEDLTSVIPNIESSFFSGKPVTIESTGKDGFVLDPSDSGTYYTR